jgi:hypothetical protein
MQEGYYPLISRHRMKIIITLKFLITTIIFTLLLFCKSELNAQVNVVTQHNDLARTGWNNSETILNTKNVKQGMFGKLYSRSVDDQIYAQILVVKNVLIPNKGVKNLVFAATVNNSVYAFDADSASEISPYWQVNLTAPGLRPARNTDETDACSGNYLDFSGNMGIVGTPVIDSVAGVLYVVARSTKDSLSGFVQYLHALDIATGAEKPNSPKLITAQINGYGDGNINGVITFNAQKQNQRSGLLLSDGKVYITYASHCDWGPYHGWILGYDKTTLEQKIVYNNTPEGYNGGIWMSGGAPSVDEAGNIYVASGNGSIGLEGDLLDLTNRSESAVKLVPEGNTLTTATFFTPKNFLTLEGGDLDFGVTQMLLIPNTNLVMTGCKDGSLYLMDRDNMGGYNAETDNVIQSIKLGNNAHLHTSLTYYKGSQKEFVYAWSENIALKAFPFDRNTNKFDLSNTINSGSQGPIGNSGAFTSVSSNGSVDSTAILWASFAANGDANQSVRPGILIAFDATDVTKELWNSSQEPTDNAGDYAKFNCPTIANGKVYLATFSNRFVVYGLTGNLEDTCNSFDIALNKPAVASSQESSQLNAAAAFDGDPGTRWASMKGNDLQYIYVDLGEKYDLCRVVLKWENALAKNFTIDVSDDEINWTTIKNITDNVSVTNYLSVKGSGRYVRMYATERGSMYAYSLYSFEVYGKQCVSNCLVPASLSATNIHETSATLHWKADGVSRFNVQYKQVTSPEWTTVSSDQNSIVLNNLDPGNDYFYRIQSVCSSSEKSAYSGTASFSQVSDSIICSPLPTRWTTQDIGNTELAGSACFSNGIFTLKGSGHGIAQNAGAFRFAFQTLVGDGEFIARISSMDALDSLNKCGIMIRETQSATSKYVFIGLTRGNTATFQARSSISEDAVSVDSGGDDIASPYWVKLVKSGSVYAAFISADGASWKQLGNTVNANFGSESPVYAGLAITSHDNSKVTIATVDHYSYSNGVRPVTLLSFDASLNLNQSIDLKWITTLEMNTSYFVIERSNGNNNFVSIDTVTALNNGSFSIIYNEKDNFPLKGTNIYRLKIIDIFGNFSYSGLASVTITDSKAPVVFPNPAKSYVHIGRGTEAIKHVNLYDISGKVILRRGYTGSDNMIDLPISGLVRGIYIVEITTSTNVYRDKLIKQ